MSENKNKRKEFNNEDPKTRSPNVIKEEKESDIQDSPYISGKLSFTEDEPVVVQEKVEMQSTYSNKRNTLAVTKERNIGSPPRGFLLKSDDKTFESPSADIRRGIGGLDLEKVESIRSMASNNFAEPISEREINSAKKIAKKIKIGDMSDMDIFPLDQNCFREVAEAISQYSFHDGSYTVTFAKGRLEINNKHVGNRSKDVEDSTAVAVNMGKLSEVINNNIDNAVQEGSKSKLLALLYLQNRLSTLPAENCNQDNAKSLAMDLQNIQSLPTQERLKAQELEAFKAKTKGGGKTKR